MENCITQYKQISFREAVKVWIKVAIHSFGGPAGQIAVMHKLLVEEKGWISENRFVHALNYCMLLPGPEAQQLATYIGWLLHKTKGGLTAGLLFILPGFIAILILSILYSLFYDISIVQAVFYGIKPAVLAIVIGAVIKIGKKVLKNGIMVMIALFAFLGIFFFNLPFPFIILFSAAIGFGGGKYFPQKFNVIQGQKEIDSDITSEKQQFPSISVFIKTTLVWVFIWSIPFLIIYLLWGTENIFFQEAVFFSKTAVVTFGGAYSVLAFIAQKAVMDFQWLQPGEMLDGLGMAETTPGPLIQVVQFVGYMGAFRHPFVTDPLLSGIIASVVVTWVTFAPCFLFIFSGAPFIEYLRGNRLLTSALSSITAAVVGVIINLAIWFTLNTLFSSVMEQNYGLLRLYVPDFLTVDVKSLFLSVVAFILYFKFRLSMLLTIFAGILIGALIYFVSWQIVSF